MFSPKLNTNIFPSEINHWLVQIEDIWYILAMTILDGSQESFACRNNLQITLEDYVKGKELEKDIALQFHIRLAHIIFWNQWHFRQRLCERFILEGQFENNSGEIVNYFFRYYIYDHICVVEDFGDLLFLYLC